MRRPADRRAGDVAPTASAQLTSREVSLSGRHLIATNGRRERRTTLRLRYQRAQFIPEWEPPAAVGAGQVPRASRWKSMVEPPRAARARPAGAVRCHIRHQLLHIPADRPRRGSLHCLEDQSARLAGPTIQRGAFVCVRQNVGASSNRRMRRVARSISLEPDDCVARLEELRAT